MRSTAAVQDGRRHIVTSSHATQPTEWYLFDEELNRLNLMVEDYPHLKPKDPDKTDTGVLQGQGWDSPAWLSDSSDEGTAASAVGLAASWWTGQQRRDSFDYWTQFLVSRGWAVLQVNCRGSRGYGDEFLQAGFKRWGLEMQDDLTDAAQYAIDNSMADPNRICIVGGSCVGYAALTGTVKTPDFYRCAVSFAGVSDLIGFLKEKRSYLDYELGWERQLGAWWSDRERLEATSPVNHADKIRTPLLIVHGAEDRTVPVEQSRAMVDALKEAVSSGHVIFCRMAIITAPRGPPHVLP